MKEKDGPRGVGRTLLKDGHGMTVYFHGVTLKGGLSGLDGPGTEQHRYKGKTAKTKSGYQQGAQERPLVYRDRHYTDPVTVGVYSKSSDSSEGVLWSHADVR